MLKRFCFIWFAYWTIYFLQPISSIYSGVELAFVTQLLFVFVVSLLFTTTLNVVPFKYSLGSRNVEHVNAREAERIITLAYVLSLVGFLFLLYDKVVIQGVDYSAGLATAREQWNVLGVEREGQASSIFSLIGYLLGSSYFLSLAILFSRKLQLTDAKRLRLMLSGFLLLLANSVITGGRSGILLAVVFVSHAYFTKNGCNEKYLFRNTRYRVVLKVCALVAAVYSLYIFNSRANASDMNLADYSLSFLEYLGLNVSDWFVGYVSTSSLGEFLAVLNLAVSYLTHSLATMAAIVEFNGEREVVVFGHLTSILTKVGLASDVHESWFLAGRFASFPGGLYHQFGLFGMVLGAALLGIVGGLVTAWHNQHPNSFFILFMSSMVESVMLLSPFLFAGDFLSFPFLITGGLIVLSVIGISKAKRY